MMKKKAHSPKKKPLHKSATKHVAHITTPSLGVRPLGDRVIVKPLDSMDLAQQTASGIFIPETISKEKPEQGIVVAVGEGKREEGKLVPMHVKVGDRVMFSRYGFDEVKIKNTEYFIVREENILAIITN